MTLPRTLILAGGLGTRLSGVIPKVPKPMAPIAGVPFLEYQIKFLKAQGFRRFTLLTGHLSEIIENHFKNGSHLDVCIDYSIEKEPLGTGGAIRRAIESTEPSETNFLVLNGDSLFTADVKRFLTLSQNQTSLALKYSHNLSRFGSVEIDSDLMISKFNEKSSDARDGYINAGLYHIRREDLDILPLGKSSIEKDVFEPLSSAKRLMGVPCGGKFVDIGTPESYDWSQDHLPSWLNLKNKPALFLDRDGILIRHKPYLHKPEEIELIPETIEVIKNAKKRGYWVIVVTNQSGVGRGYFTEQDCARVNQTINHLFLQNGAEIDAWYACYDHPEAENKDYRGHSLRRKPQPGMLLQASEDFPTDLTRSFMIGDNITDQIELPDLRTILVSGDFDLSKAKDSTCICNNAQELSQIISQLL